MDLAAPEDTIHHAIRPVIAVRLRHTINSRNTINTRLGNTITTIVQLSHITTTTTTQ